MNNLTKITYKPTNHKEQKGTGGILNKINEKYRCNSIRNTTAIMKLIKIVKPSDRTELVHILNNYDQYKNDELFKDIKINKTLDDWCLYLYGAYRHYSECNDNVEYKDLNDCTIFMYTLFTDCSISGDKMEKKFMESMNEVLLSSGLHMSTVTDFADRTYAIDLMCKDSNGEVVFAVQVKPKGYMHVRDEIKVINKRANDKFTDLYNAPIFYVYYRENRATKDKTFITSEGFKQLMKLVNTINERNEY